MCNVNIHTKSAADAKSENIPKNIYLAYNANPQLFKFHRKTFTLYMNKDDFSILSADRKIVTP